MRRPVAFITALMLMAVPIAAAACEVTCATTDAHRPTSTHSCHQHVPPMQGATVDGVHMCGHDDGMPSAFERVSTATDAPASASNAFVAVVPQTRTITPRFVADASPPGFLTRTGQLRI